MRFIVMVKGDASYEAGAPPNPQLIAAIGKHGEQLSQAGVMLSTEGLQPSSRGAKVSLSGGKVTVTDGPFTEAKEVVGGFAIFKVNSKAEVVQLAKDFLKIHEDILGPTWSGECEIRELWDVSSSGTVECQGRAEELAEK
jgi:hypothetical protein